jgi:mono/diheme cytochrome c family protein
VYYRQYCGVCHGPAAKGDGPFAPDLKVKPADLTQVNQKAGGEFPMWRVFEVIEGQQEVKGHGTREMPIWGTEFKMEIQEENPQFTLAVHKPRAPSKDPAVLERHIAALRKAGLK